jgi:hypothetical protein
MMMTPLSDGLINRMCGQNAAFSVLNLAVNISITDFIGLKYKYGDGANL